MVAPQEEKKGPKSALDSVCKMVGVAPYQSALSAVLQAESLLTQPRPHWRTQRGRMVNQKVVDILESNYGAVAEAFLALDANCDGKVSARELRTGFACLDLDATLTEEVLHEALSVADVDRSGTIDIEEFLRSFGNHPVSKDEISDGLNQLGKTADGRGLVYLGCNLKTSKINDVVAIREFVHLQFLDLSENDIEDLSPLGCLRYLVTLNASHNQITEVLSFRAPYSLRDANLSHNQIRVINPVNHHRFLETLDLSHNQIENITGLSECQLLKKLVLDHNQIVELAGLSDLPLQHLSVRGNRLTSINGVMAFSEADLELLALFEDSYDSMEDAFMAMDVNVDGTISRKELREGLNSLHAVSSGEKPEEQRAALRRAMDQIIQRVDKNDDGTIELQEFVSLFRRVMPANDGRDPGIRLLKELQYIDLSENTISNMQGLSGHPALRTIKMSATGIHELSELEHLKELPLLEYLDLNDTPLCKAAGTAAQATCTRLKILYQLQAPQGSCKLVELNSHRVTAEEIVSALNFHDEKHPQFQDYRRDDSQDLPPELYK